MPFSRIKFINLSVNPYFLWFWLVSMSLSPTLKSRWNKFEIMPHQRWNIVEATFKSGCLDVFQRWFSLVLMLDTDIKSTLYNVENPMSDFGSFPTLYQCYLKVDPQRWNNVDPTLKCWLGNSLWRIGSHLRKCFWWVWRTSKLF